MQRGCGRSIFADLLLLCGVPALVAAKVTVGVAVVIGVAIILFGAFYYLLITVLVRLTRSILPKGHGPLSAALW